ncbi:DEKNAAC104514 [Brettanomyces naardenensis]|uniref:DEKNAAC104514 n=1 Tax=Brettanomyces naardenensis TaxID=13370 RepID=A0A448YRP6_BRENA|nr:DEKNAAC104514 [Brettanomyces naardenensis]
MSLNSNEEDEKKTPIHVEINELDPVLSTVISLDNKEIKIHAKDADDAMQFIDDIRDLEIDPAYEKKLLRKIDWMLMPIIIALMSCQLMDKTTNSYAAIMGMRADLNMLTGDVYNWVGSAFYFGYMVFEFPSNILLQRFPLSKTLSTAVMIWGVVLMCHAACHSAAPFLVCRVILGAFEGFMNPSYIILTGMWWRKKEQYMRTCVWWGFQGFGTLLGAGIAYGLAKNRVGDYSFASWRLLYIITGIITILLGVISFFHMPDSPAKAWFLNDKEKKYCLERSRENQQGFGNHKFKKSQFIESFKDPTVYIFFVYGLSYAIPNGGFNNFGSILLNGDFGFSTLDALLMNMPGGAIDIVFPMTIAYINYKFLKNRRLVSCTIVNTIVVVGMCLLNFTSPRGSRLAGYLSFYLATAVSAGVCSIISSNIAGYTKKATVNTIFLVGYCAGNIIGPQTFQAKQAPGYVGAKAAMLASFIVGTLCLISLFIIYVRRNKAKDAKRAALGDKYSIPDNVAFADLTDLENPEFRYSL